MCYMTVPIFTSVPEILVGRPRFRTEVLNTIHNETHSVNKLERRGVQGVNISSLFLSWIKDLNNISNLF